MALDDFYYQTVAKQRAAEAQASATQQQLVKHARAASRRQRATRREVRQLQDAIEGRRGLRRVLRGVMADLFARPGTQQPTGGPSGASQGGAPSSPDTVAAGRQPYAGGR